MRHLKATKSESAAKDVEARFKNYVLNHARLAATELSKLTPAQIEAWRKALRELPTRSGGRRGERRSDSTLNRDMTCFRASLNLAYLDGLLTTDFTWRSKLRPIKNADQRRDLYLDRAQRLKFIGRGVVDPLGTLVLGMWHEWLDQTIVSTALPTTSRRSRRARISSRGSSQPIC